MSNAVVSGKLTESQEKFYTKLTQETYWKALNLKQQYNINKPNEIRASIETGVLNSDTTYTAPEFNNSPDNIPGYGIGMTARQQYERLFRQTYYNYLQTAFNNSFNLGISNIGLGREYSLSSGVPGQARFGWQKSLNFINDILSVGRSASEIGVNLHRVQPHYNFNMSTDAYGRSYSTYGINY